MTDEKRMERLRETIEEYAAAEADSQWQDDQGWDDKVIHAAHDRRDEAKRQMDVQLLNLERLLKRLRAKTQKENT